jgi:hypothetical protein
MKVIQLVNSFESFIKLSKQDLPVRISFRYKGLVREVMLIVEDYEKVRKDLFIKYQAVYNQKNNTFEFKDVDSKNAWQKEVSSLLDTEIYLRFEPIPLSLIAENNIKLSSLDLTLLDWLIKEDDNATEKKEK